jgi:hypothetical protein
MAMLPTACLILITLASSTPLSSRARRLWLREHPGHQQWMHFMAMQLSQSEVTALAKRLLLESTPFAVATRYG